MTIYFIRHTKTEVESGTCYGQYDAGLADDFESEAIRIKNMLHSPIDIIYTSPLKRCTALAGIISGGEYCIDKRIVEIDFGLWEMVKWNCIERNSFEKWCGDYYNVPAGITGENCRDLLGRVRECYNEIIHSHFDSIALITHAGVIRCFFSIILNMKMEDTFKFELSFGSISKVNINGEFVKFEYINKV